MLSPIGVTNKVVPFFHNYLMNDIVIANSASTKYLGVTISHDLNWNQHCDNICSKANSMLGLLRRFLSDCSMDVKSKAYTTLVRPKLEYASSVWNPYTKRNIYQIELVKPHIAARFVFRDYSNCTHVTPMLKQLGWDTLYNADFRINYPCFTTSNKVWLVSLYHLSPQCISFSTYSDQV